MSRCLCDTVIQLPTYARGLWYYYFIASHLFHVGCTWVPGWFPLSVTSYSELKGQQARTALSSSHLPNWLEPHLGIFVIEQIFYLKGFSIRLLLFFRIIILAILQTCVLWEPSSVGLVWCYLTIGEMSWFINWAGKSDCKIQQT